MFDLFKKSTESKPHDVKSVRDSLLRFIKDELQKLEGGEGANVKGLHLFMAPAEEERHLYEAAVYLDQESRFQAEEVQRIADDYAIDLPEGWVMEITLVDALPAECKKIPDLDAGLFIKTKKHTIQKSATAYIKILSGEAEKEEYKIESGSGKVTIGREKKVQAEDGFFRINTIAFPATSQNDCNKYVSRSHAHVEWDNDSGSFLLFADEGGAPPRNKIKVKSTNVQTPVKLQSTHTGHALQEGDQIILGESVVLEFSYKSEGV